MKKRNLMLMAELLGSGARFRSAMLAEARIDEDGVYHSPIIAFVSTFTETQHAGGYMVSGGPGTRSNDQGILVSGQGPLNAGTVLGKILDGASGTYTATGGNAGNFTCGTVTVGAGIIEGTYKIEFIAPTVFNVVDPNEGLVAEGHTGVAFSAGGLGFTITAGGTPAAAGDSATVAIAANANVGKWTQLNASGADGSQNAAAILWGRTDASAADAACTVTVRSSEVNVSELTWPVGYTTNQIAAAKAQLLAIGIVAR